MATPRTDKKAGFTLIELLMVISIIALLSSIVLASLANARNLADTAKVKEDFVEIRNYIELAEDNKNEVLGKVTGNFCTRCSFISTTTMLSQPSALATNASSWTKIGYASPPIDPWGDPYTLDENEYEQVGNPCIKDTVYSAGPDHKVTTSDDITFNPPYFICPD